MKDTQKYFEFIVDLAIIAGIVYLASQGKDGWGWLIFLFILKNC